LTGFSSFACWRFLEGHKIYRPGKCTYKIWDQFAAAEYVMAYGYEAAEKKFDCSRSALYNVMKRVGRTLGHCSGHYGLNQLRKMFGVRVETILYWIKTGALEATLVTYGGKETSVVSDDQLRRFLSREAGNLILRRFPEKRAEFLSNYLYTENHMNLGLPRTRESKKEGDAFRKTDVYKESQKKSGACEEQIFAGTGKRKPLKEKGNAYEKQMSANAS